MAQASALPGERSDTPSFPRRKKHKKSQNKLNKSINART
jgi:hypothetical protein